ncbi:MAG: undecaprenyldiphospho-muramoylpentapeptide beta-N-acetylglucosaminyltransferase [Oceanicoccus sp.]
MTATLPRSVLVMAGGTGGHVFPALAAAKCLREQGINVEWLGTSAGIESRLVPPTGIKLHCINVAGLRGKNLSSIIRAVFQLFGSMVEAFRVISTLKPVCILGMGGFTSGPGGLVAWLTRCPLVIHEQNAVAGTTNRLLSKLATRVLLGYPIELGGPGAIFVGNPVRDDITQLPAPEERLASRSDRLHVLVLGGSLGAKPINDLFPSVLKSIDSEQRPLVWHQAGQRHVDDVRELYRQVAVPATVEAFIDDMAAAYSWADVVVCRAGALTVAELTAAGVASLLIPLPQAIDDHQTENARWLESGGAGKLLVQSELTMTGLAGDLCELSGNREKVLQMSRAARDLAKTDAAERVAEICMEVAGE